MLKDGNFLSCAYW
ncbi:unnamed protein product [Acanthoscelides obtectus]|uniref:Uncharacterized protein n=1 Tax=Acanthoscelides obtectus TaxID=200917 RepID=A0A9P0JNE6_ACAOB|nr:unnamed protein product [Acanthoscelides obtectus]CAK1672366.1 hypothetical protein AOBTE_LOCUS28825 [Acanthoscelides obtectus]